MLKNEFDGRKPLSKVIGKISGRIMKILPDKGDYSEPRIYEIAFALNRLRSLRCRQMEEH